MKAPLSTIMVKAKLRLKTTAEGGRQNGIKTGYRPNHIFEYEDNESLHSHIGEITFDDSEWIALGEERMVSVQFLYFPGLDKYLDVGRKWWIHEGQKVVGEAEIIEVLG